MKSIVSFLIFSLLFTSFTWAQDGSTWEEMMHDPSINFYKTQQAFEADLGNRPYEKGLGIKQYRRWEYYWENRVDEKGNFPQPGHVLNEMTNYYATHPSPEHYKVGSGDWSLIGPIEKPLNGTSQPNGNGRLLCIAFHPTDANTIYVGAASGGFFKSTDNGSSWTEYSSGLVRLGVSSIVIHPANPNIIYIGTGDRDGGDAPGYGVWRSTDGGLTWAAHNNGMGDRTVYEILMHPTNSSILLASTNGSRLYRSTDGGLNWTFTSTSSSAKDIAFHPTDPNIVYAAGTRFDRSVDNGQTFTPITSGLPTTVSRISVGVSADEPNWVYLFAGGATGVGSFKGIYRSTNSGVNFTQRTTTPNIMGYAANGNDDRDQAWYDMTLVVDPNDANTLFAGSINIWKSSDGGSTMALSAHWVGGGGVDDIHADQHVLEYSPHTNHLYNGNDGGIYYTTDNGFVWNEISNGLYIAQVYKIGVSQQTLDKVINGYQDNGTAINRLTSFSTEIGGDGMECIIDPTDDKYMYGALYYGDIRRSTNSGYNFSGITGGITESGAWVTPYKLDPNNPDRMIAGFDNVWRSDDVKTGANWTKISSFTGTSNIVDLAIAPSNSATVYLARGRDGERFWKSTNVTSGSPSWTNLSANLPVNKTPIDIEIDPADDRHLFISSQRKIYESTDGGSTWSDVSGTLPDLSINTILIDKDSPVNAMYVGMDVGVYYIDDNLTDWVMYSTGLPNVEVTELEIHYNPTECKSTLYAATYGQGLWKSSLKDPGTITAVACFESSLTDICMGESITFEDKSSYTPIAWNWTITPATFSFLGGTNATSQNPRVQFNAAGSYSIQLQATNSTGSDIELKTGYITVASSVAASSFDDDFEGHALCGVSNDCKTTTCALSGTSWINLTNTVEDDIDWRIDENGTASSNTGPTTDFNPGTTSGNYAYTESSSCNNKVAILESACINIDQNYDLEFAYHMFGSAMGSLHVDILSAGSWIENVVPAITGDQGNNWLIQRVSLAAYQGNTIKIRLRAITGTGFASDIAIDAIKFVSKSALSIAEFKSSSATCNNEGYNKLNWAMSNSLTDKHFVVEKYNKNSLEWRAAIGTINTNNQLNYSFVDTKPYTGENLYRLGIREGDNVLTYSPMITAVCAPLDMQTFEVYPNPFKNEVNLQFNAKVNVEIPYTVTNLLGQVLLQHTLNAKEGTNRYRLPIQNLPQGVYLLHIEGKMIKLVKQ